MQDEEASEFLHTHKTRSRTLPSGGKVQAKAGIPEKEVDGHR